MRVTGRRDFVLFVGIAIAVAVAFSGHLSRLAINLRQVDFLRGVQFVPALALLAVVLIMVLVWRSHEARRGSGLPVMAGRCAIPRTSHREAAQARNSRGTVDQGGCSDGVLGRFETGAMAGTFRRDSP